MAIKITILKPKQEEKEKMTNQLLSAGRSKEEIGLILGEVKK
ncbi:MAG: hypothetical protein HeimC3_53610 [Candidatus Heimdallarchaeota archaeon LC_3]|nr:MAG: hypothetical protein HeimC3_53610 [Candidatus Heimdallarchaeota archaeon LC_3]